MGRTGPWSSLSPVRPPGSLVTGPTLASIAGQVAASAGGQLLATTYLHSRPWWSPLHPHTPEEEIVVLRYHHRVHGLRLPVPLLGGGLLHRAPPPLPPLHQLSLPGGPGHPGRRHRPPPPGAPHPLHHPRRPRAVFPTGPPLPHPAWRAALPLCHSGHCDSKHLHLQR